MPIGNLRLVTGSSYRAGRRHETDEEPERRWVPRFEHLLIDQTEQDAESVTGAVAARLLRRRRQARRASSAGWLIAPTRLFS